MIRRLSVFVVLAGLLLAGCAPGEPDGIRVEDVWVRAASASTASAAHGQTANSAAFLTLHNDSPADDRLVEVRSDAAASVEIHESFMEGEVMRMRHLVDGLPLPAGERVELAPGGYHIMLIGLHQDLIAGESVTLTLVFAGHREITVSAEVRAP